VSTAVQLQNMRTGTVYNLTSGKASSVPDGRYNVGTDIVTPGSSPSDTMVDRAITVSRPVAITLDARQGRRVRFTVSDPRARSSFVFLAAGSPATGLEYAGGGGEVMTSYVVPTKLPSGWNFYAWAGLASETRSGSPVVYGLIRVIKGRIPSATTWSASVSKLTDLHVSVRRLSPGQAADVQLAPDVSGPDKLPFPIWSAKAEYGGPAPYTVDFRLTPGYAWQQTGPYGEAVLNNPPIWRARRYTETFGAVTFSPDWEAEQDVGVIGNTLYSGTLDGDFLIEDPAYTSFTGDSAGLPASELTELYLGSKLIARGRNNEPRARISAATRWYREQVVARPTSGQMFARVTLDYRFQAAAQPNDLSYSPDYIVPTIRPAGLNADNAARPGGKTTVPIRLTDSAPGQSVRSVQVWASGNGGKSWSSLTVRHARGRWTVTVSNPRKTGYMSLRVSAVLSSGVSTEVTVINAYGV